MLGNFEYSNPTRVYFGQDSLSCLADELKKYGKTVMISYGQGSIKKSGLYGQVVDILKACGKTVVDDGGIMPNPTVEKLADGCQKVRDRQVDFILAVGGGSCCDYAKAVSVSAYCGEDPWEKYFIRFDDVSETTKIVPVGCILTMVGTGSEMNGGAVITNHAQKLKVGHVFGENVFPKFSILNPTYTLTLPNVQMVSGIYDIMSHVMEQYFSGEDDNTTDYIAEGLMRSLIVSSRAAVKNPKDYEARSNLMWTATWALNTLLAKGKDTDWEVHMLGQAVAAHTDAMHGLTLAAVSLPYYRYVMPYGLKKFMRFAVNVWGVTQNGATDEKLAESGLIALSDWISELGISQHLTDLGVTPEMVEPIANSTLVMQGGYKTLSRDEIVAILGQSL